LLFISILKILACDLAIVLTKTQKNTFIMKNSKNNKKRHISNIILTVLLTITSFAFITTEYKQNIALEKSLGYTYEQAEITADLIEAIYAEEEEAIILPSKKMVEIYDANDALLFQGSKVDWDNNTSDQLTIMKRKAEFFFESDGTEIYKVF